MKILLVGDGAREHALSEQLARSSELYVAMERLNPGIKKASQKVFVCDFSNVEAIGGWAIRENIDLALITSEVALAKGLSDALDDAGVKLACPPSSGTMIGENTVYAYNLMGSAGIACPRFFSCKDEREVKSAMKEIRQVVLKPAVKVDWEGTKFGENDLRSKEDSIKYAKQMIKRHGSVVVEETIDGEGFSLQAVTDGKSISVMPPVHIVKRVTEGGALTEGMGGFSSGKILPFMSGGEVEYARDCLWNIVRSLKAKGVDYKGPIRGTFMVTKDKTIMLDVYATFGDIDTLNNLPLLRTQLSEILTSVVEGTLQPFSFVDKSTVVKYLVPEGYPGKSKKSAIEIDERALWNNGAKVYFDSVEEKAGLYTSDDRTLAICASGQTLDEAESKCEDAAISVKGLLTHRRDIASKDYVNRQIKHLAVLRQV